MSGRGRSGSSINRRTTSSHASSYTSDAVIGSSVDAQSLDGGEVGSSSGTEQRAAKKHLTLVTDQLYPSGDVSRVVTESFHKYMNHRGFSWKAVPDAQRAMYFKYFTNHFYWDKTLNDEIVYKKWRTRAGERYKDYVHKIKRQRNNEDPPPYIPKDHWPSWKEYWNRDYVKAKAEKARKNRMTEPDGEGTGIVKHRGGSKSILGYAMDIAKERGVDLTETYWDVFQRIHITKDGNFTDEKSRKIAMQVEDQVQALSQPAPGTNEVMEVDRNKILKDVLGGPTKKRRLFGAGPLARVFVGGDSSSTSQLDSIAYQQKLGELQDELELQRQECQQYEERIQAEMKARDEAQAQVLEQFQAQLRAQQEAIDRLLGSRNVMSDAPPS